MSPPNPTHSKKANAADATTTATASSDSYAATLKLPNRPTDGASKEPSQLKKFREKKLAEFQAMGFPTRRQEAWKYMDLRPVLDTPFATPENTDGKTSLETIAPHLLSESRNSCLVFINGIFDATFSAIDGLPEGVVIEPITGTQKPLNGTADQEADLLQIGLDSIPNGEEDAFTLINSALFNCGAVIRIEDNIACHPPIEILLLSDNLTEEPQAIYPRILLDASKNSSARLVVNTVGRQSAEISRPASLTNLVVELKLSEGAKLDYTFIQQEDENAYQFSVTRALLAKHSALQMTAVALGSKKARNSMQVQLTGEGAECVINGLSVLTGETQVFHHLNVEHQVPHCTSRQLFKNILDDSSIAEFDGTIHVQKPAQQTDATQLNKNLLLSGNARALTRPQLRIDADDVKCAHGATVGQLEEEELFYLASRGIGAEEARCILTYGFAEEVIEKIPGEERRNYLNQRILKNLGQSTNPTECFRECSSNNCP